jgi:putative ABC transport system permease protein
MRNASSEHPLFKMKNFYGPCKGLLLVGSGILLGLVASLLSVRILRSQLWGVSAFDRGAFILAPLALLTTGLPACYTPARRATRVDPMVALRHD